MNKKVAFMTLLCLCFVGVNAQSLYKIGEVTKGKKASYYCSSVYKDVIQFHDFCSLWEGYTGNYSDSFSPKTIEKYFK